MRQVNPPRSAIVDGFNGFKRSRTFWISKDCNLCVYKAFGRHTCPLGSVPAGTGIIPGHDRDFTRWTPGSTGSNTDAWIMSCRWPGRLGLSRIDKLVKNRAPQSSRPFAKKLVSASAPQSTILDPQKKFCNPWVLSQKSYKFHYKTQKPITYYIFAFESPLSFLISSFSSRLLVIFFIFVDLNV